MNEVDANWQFWAAQSACIGEGQSEATRCESQRMDQNAPSMCGCPTDTSTSRPIRDAESQINDQSPDRLAGGISCCNSGIKGSHGGPTGIRKLASMSSQQDDFLSESKKAECLNSVMRVVDFVRIVNSCGFGQVLTERNVLRQRRAFPSIDAGRGRINVIEFVAAMCSRRRRAKRTEDLSVKDLELLLETQEYRCALTNEPLTPDNLAVDHIVPISEGGSFDVENSQLVTKAANRAKHTMSQKQFVTMCHQVANTVCDS